MNKRFMSGKDPLTSANHTEPNTMTAIGISGFLVKIRTLSSIIVRCECVYKVLSSVVKW